MAYKRLLDFAASRTEPCGLVTLCNKGIVFTRLEFV